MNNIFELFPISIHALLAESDVNDAINGCNPDFISIHALLAESDVKLLLQLMRVPLFLSTLSLRRATDTGLRQDRPEEFLSTLSLRRATYFGLFFRRHAAISIHALLAESDQSASYNAYLEESISIHALLAESDNSRTQSDPAKSISIHALLAESDNSAYGALDGASISIHALLAESDNANLRRHRGNDDFYPRSPCGERRVPLAELTAESISIHALLAESDIYTHPITVPIRISIHALLAESDLA